MMRVAHLLPIVIAVSALLTGRGAAGPPDVPVLSPGVYTRALERDDGPRLWYAISVPSTYNHATPVPLVLALHFGVQGGSSQYAGRDVLRILIGPALAELGAVMVAPDALEGGPWTTPDNERAVLALLDAVTKSYRIDAKKVIVTGFSMGGAGTWHFAAKYPNRFSAAVPVAGRPPDTMQGWRVPVFAVHSRNDQVVPIAPAERRVDELKRAGVSAEIVVLDGPTHFQTSAHAEGLKRAVPWLRQLWQKDTQAK
jgi:predicted peptidase